MSRNLLHKSRVEAFKAWLTAEGIAWREPRGDWQIMQVELPNGGWACLYERAHMPEHVTVDRRLEQLVHYFIHCRPKSNPEPQPEVMLDTFDVTVPPWD